MARKRSKPTEQANQTKAENFFVLDLRHIKANTYQSRNQGVIGNLNAVGFGLFERLKGHDDKEPLWEILCSDKPVLWQLVVGLIDEYEPEIKELADSIAGSTQPHNIGITQEKTDRLRSGLPSRRSLSSPYRSVAGSLSACGCPSPGKRAGVPLADQRAGQQRRQHFHRNADACYDSWKRVAHQRGPGTVQRGKVMRKFQAGDVVREAFNGYVSGPLMRIIGFAASGAIAICRTLPGSITKFVLVTLLVLIPIEAAEGLRHDQALEDFPNHPIQAESFGWYASTTNTTTTTASPHLPG